MGGTACLTSENAPPLGGSAGTAVRGEGDSRRHLKALASLSFGPGVLLPNGGSSDSRPFLRDEPFLSGTLGTLLCPRRPALDFMSVSSRSAGMAVSFHRGTSVPGNSPHLLQGCFIQPWSLFLFSLSLFFLLKRLLFKYWTSQTYSAFPSFPLQVLRCPFHPAPQVLCHRFLSYRVRNLQEPSGTDARSLSSLQGRVSS